MDEISVGLRFQLLTDNWSVPNGSESFCALYQILVFHTVHCACCLLFAGFLLCLLFTLKMKAVCSFNTMVNFYQTTWLYIPKDSTFQVSSLLSL